MSVGQQKTVSSSSGTLQLRLEQEMAESTAGSADNADYIEQTRAAMYEYVFRRAMEDNGLSDQQVRTFQNVEQEAGGGTSQASVVGRRLAELGDEIDAQYHEEMEELVQLTGTPERAFSMFSEIVKQLFEWDETGRAKITVGRLAALMSYCYHLARNYLSQHMTVYGLMSFLGLLAGWLFQFLLKAKFYEWLERQGGWGKLLVMTTAGWGQHVYLVIGVASLVIWAYSYLRSK